MDEQQFLKISPSLKLIGLLFRKRNGLMIQKKLVLLDLCHVESFFVYSHNTFLTRIGTSTTVDMNLADFLELFLVSFDY